MKRGKLFLTVIALLALASPADAERGRVDLYEESEKAKLLVARITAPTTEGAGIVFHIDGHFAYGFTAKHVLYQQGRVVRDLKAQFQAWPNQKFEVKHLNLHPDLDLAVFQADLRPLGLSLAELQRGIPLDQLGKSKDLNPGNPLFFVGHSTAHAWITPKSAVKFAVGHEDSFLFEEDCPRGHSGGGVFDREWRLVGMMIEEERPYCRALRIEPILRTVQGWKLDISLLPGVVKERSPQKSGDITVAVVDFDNRSDKHLPRLGGMAQDITTSSLVSLPGVRLVTRDRLAKVRKEHRLKDTVLAGTGASKLGQLLDADALVTGSILAYDVERRVFEGFGTSALMDTFRMEISFQVLEVASGRVQYAKTFPVERVVEYPKASSAPSQPRDMTNELLTALVNDAQRELRSALMQLASGRATAGEFIEVAVTTNPAGADIILNGAFVRKTPYTLRLKPAIHEIELVVQGYRPWKQRVRVQPGTAIDVNLIHLSKRIEPE
ncbi:MAG TPA: trypsin-like peptidase domain-containing protein [Thermoanaerobaculia bacterium]|nr:trypsin-like peptidase domain-containing protein [Thermoanaerobaculia bacterium]